MKITLKNFYLSKKHLQKLLNFIDRHVQSQALATQLKLIIITGCRPIETLSYRMEDGFIFMTVAKKKTKQVIRKFENRYFLQEYHKKYTTRTILNYFRKLFSISCRDYRHIFATKAYRNSKDLLFVQNLMFHSKPQITQIYLESYKAPLDNIWK